METWKVTIPGLLPGLNEYIDAERAVKGKYKAAAMKKQAENVIGFMVKTQLRGVRFDRPVIIHYRWIEPNRRRDKDNVAFAKKFIQDSLVHAGVLVNDGWNQIEGFTDDFAVDPKNPRVEVTKSTLYSYIRKGVFLTLEMRNLPRHGKNKRGYTRTHKKGTRASAGTSIEERPEEVNARATVGHWEMDSVLGKKRTKAALLVLSERYSRKEIIIKVKDHTAASVVRALDRLERKMGSPAFRSIFRSITVDNGSEFADAAGMEQSCRSQGPRTKVYYCHPYSSWERGTNENTNGLIRRWFPKGTDFTKVTTQEIQKVEDWLNTYPREILGFLSADAVFSTAFAACV